MWDWRFERVEGVGWVCIGGMNELVSVDVCGW